jgi:hypothetical protein
MLPPLPGATGFKGYLTFVHPQPAVTSVINKGFVPSLVKLKLQPTDSPLSKLPKSCTSFAKTILVLSCMPPLLAIDFPLLPEQLKKTVNKVIIKK